MSNTNAGGGGSGGSGGGGGGAAGGASFIPNNIWVTPGPPQQSFTITVGGSGGSIVMGGDLTGESTPTPVIKSNKDGCTCKKCKEHYEYAEANQPDGSLICWACRHRY